MKKVSNCLNSTRLINSNKSCYFPNLNGFSFTSAESLARNYSVDNLARLRDISLLVTNGQSLQYLLDSAFYFDLCVSYSISF